MTLQGRSIVVLSFPRYQEMEFWYPVLRIREEGGTALIVTPGAGEFESYLGYPIIGDVAAADVDVASIAAVVVPGAVGTRPGLGEEQIHLIKAASAAQLPIFASSTGAALVADLVAALPGSRRAEDADGLPDLIRQLIAELAN